MPRLSDSAPSSLRKAIFSIWLASRSEEHTSELQSLMRISYAFFCLKKKNQTKPTQLCTNNFHILNHFTPLSLLLIYTTILTLTYTSYTHNITHLSLPAPQIDLISLH